MSVPPTHCPERDRIELESAVHWPTVTAGAVLLLGLVACFLVPLFLSGPSAPSAHEVAAVAPAPRLSPALESEVEIPQPAPPAPKVIDTPPVALPAAPVVAVIVRDKPGQARQAPSPRMRAALAASKPIAVASADLAQDRPSAAMAAERRAEAFARAEQAAAYWQQNPHHEARSLNASLEKIPIVDLDTKPGTLAKLIKSIPSRSSKTTEQKQKEPEPVLVTLVARRPDLEGLPVRMGTACQVAENDVEAMEEISPRLRRQLSPLPRNRRSLSTSLQQNQQALGLLRKQASWLTEASVSTLVQMLQVEIELLRLQLIGMLSQIPGQKASAALAQRVLHDPSWNVRLVAIRVLRERPEKEYRALLMEGLRYPLPAVADHAAAALVALKLRDATKDLVQLLDAPDPRAPVLGPDNIWRVREVVRINHLRGCVMCHAPSASDSDPVRGLVPIPGQELPQQYYASRSGSFVRADIVYLRQDFSLMMPVAKPDKWPDVQRFDFVARERTLTMAEEDLWRTRRMLNALRKGDRAPSYPQRDSVLFALRELTGKDVGSDSRQWQHLVASTRPKPGKRGTP